MNKKLISLFFLIILSLSFVSAQDFRYSSQRIIDQLADAYSPVLEAFLGGEDYTGFLLFEKFLIFVIVLSMVYIGLSRVTVINEKRGVIWVITIAVSLLSVRYMSYTWINTLVLQYGVLGIALTSILPFIIYFFFLHGVSDSSLVRKIGWILFAVVYIGLWATAETEVYGQVYFWTFVASLVILLFDGTLHRIYDQQQMKAAGNLNKWQEIARLRNEIYQVQTAMRAGMPQRQGEKLIKNYEKRIKRLYKM